jgi:hypothetical protein
LDFDSAAGLSVSCSIFFLEIPLLRLRFAARQLILLLLAFPSRGKERTLCFPSF